MSCKLIERFPFFFSVFLSYLSENSRKLSSPRVSDCSRATQENAKSKRRNQSTLAYQKSNRLCIVRTLNRSFESLNSYDRSESVEEIVFYYRKWMVGGSRESWCPIFVRESTLPLFSSTVFKLNKNFLTGILIRQSIGYSFFLNSILLFRIFSTSIEASSSVVDGGVQNEIKTKGENESSCNTSDG